MRLFNTVSGAYDTLTTEPGQKITLYVCGVTPYDTTHVGHARTFLVFDALVRFLRATGAAVRYCQNVTDIDDDILRKAAELGMPWDELARRETQRLVEDMANLRALPPDYFPRATQEIDRIIPLVQRLLDSGAAYERNNSIYYHVKADPGFASYMHMGYDDLLALANQHGNFPDDPNKQDPLDFVLWQAAVPGEPSWPSPWGPGRPGWHIECSSMAMTYLGEQVTIHGGGSDLRFPHHACEIAQSESATGRSPFARFWMHVGMVYLDGQKMSKSLGNMVFVRDALNYHTPDALRYYLLSFHYRDIFAYEEGGVVAAGQTVRQLREALGVLSGEGEVLDPSSYRARFIAALEDDFNTHAALTVLAELGGAILAADGGRVTVAQRELRTLAMMLGLLTRDD